MGGFLAHDAPHKVFVSVIDDLLTVHSDQPGGGVFDDKKFRSDDSDGDEDVFHPDSFHSGSDKSLRALDTNVLFALTSSSKKSMTRNDNDQRGWSECRRG